MFLVFSFNDLSNAILSVVRIIILLFVFIILPLKFFSLLYLVATSGGWYLILGLVLLAAAFAFAILKGRPSLATGTGIAAVALAVYILFTGFQMRSEEREAIEFGSPRNVLWAESLWSIRPGAVCRDECATFRPLMPQSIRAVTDGANLDRREYYDFGETARRTANDIEILNYRITPGDLFDRYVEVARTEGDWLAFHATCVLESGCGRTDTLAETFEAVEDRYGIDLSGHLAGYLGLDGVNRNDFQTSPAFAAACRADDPCRSLMSALHWPVIIGANSGEPVVVQNR